MKHHKTCISYLTILLFCLISSECLASPTFPEIILSSCKKQIYPAASVRLGEEGETKILIFISEKGIATESKIVVSSGFERLDEATQEYFLNCTYKPSVVNGKNASSWHRVKFKWAIGETELENSFNYVRVNQGIDAIYFTLGYQYPTSNLDIKCKKGIVPISEREASPEIIENKFTEQQLKEVEMSEAALDEAQKQCVFKFEEDYRNKMFAYCEKYNLSACVAGGCGHTNASSVNASVVEAALKFCQVK